LGAISRVKAKNTPYKHQIKIKTPTHLLPVEEINENNSTN